MPQIPPNCDLVLGAACVDKSTPGVTVWTMAADTRFANPGGVVQGGFLGALADTAMAASVVTWSRDRGLRVAPVSAEIKVSFLRPARTGGTLTATASVVSGGRRVAFTEAEIVDEAGTSVARASSTYLLVPRD